MAKGGNSGTSAASTAAGIGASVGTSNASTNSASATNAAGNPGSAAAAQAAAAQANAAAANAANSGKGSDSTSNSGGVSVNTGNNNAAVNSGNVTASYDNAGSLSGKGYESSTSGWGGGYGAAAAMNGLTTATQKGEDGHAQHSTAGGFGSGYATSSPNAAPTNMGSFAASLGPIGSALANATNAITGGDTHTATYYGRVDGSGYFGPASLDNESGPTSATSSAISNLGKAGPATTPATTPAATPANTPSVGSVASDAVNAGVNTGISNASNNTNNNTYSSGANSGATYRGGTVTDNGSGGSISSGITPPSRDTSSIGLGVYNPDKANYDQDSWNRGMEVQSSSLVSDEECKAFAKRAFSENTEPFKKVRVTIIKKV